MLQKEPFPFSVSLERVIVLFICLFDDQTVLAAAEIVQKWLLSISEAILVLYIKSLPCQEKYQKKACSELNKCVRLPSYCAEKIVFCQVFNILCYKLASPLDGVRSYSTRAQATSTASL